MKVKHITLTKHDYDLFVKDESNERAVTSRIALQDMIGEVAAFVSMDDWNAFLKVRGAAPDTVRLQIRNTARSIVPFRDHPTILNEIKKMYIPHLEDELKELQVQRIYIEEQLKQVEDTHELTSLLLNDFLIECGYAHDDKQQALSKMMHMLHPDEMEDVDIFEY